MDLFEQCNACRINTKETGINERATGSVYSTHDLTTDRPKIADEPHWLHCTGYTALAQSMLNAFGHRVNWNSFLLLNVIHSFHSARFD